MPANAFMLMQWPMHIVHVFGEGPFCGLTFARVEARAGSLIAGAIWAGGSMGLRQSSAGSAPRQSSQGCRGRLA
eukprot:542521-Pyramimonas_sp.AAC.1